MRELSWDGLLNVRDLGGLPLAGGGETRFGAVARSDSPLFLSEAGWRALHDHGIRTIVDLRCPSEQEYEPSGGVVRACTPIFEMDDREFMTRVEGVPDTGAFYRVLVDYCHGRLARAVAAVGDAPEGGVLVHCHAGRDRTGVVSAFLVSLAGVPDEAIAADYVATEAALRPRHEEELALAASEEERAWLERIHSLRGEFILAALEAAGDVREYLLAGGATEEQVERCRSRLVAEND